MQETRARPAFEKAVRAGAQQERALQRRDGAVDRPHRSERPVVAALSRARAAVLEDLRRPMVRGDDDVGKRLVVAQQHVEARAQPLDQIGFEQQRLGLGRGGDEFHRRGRGNHPFDARVVTGRPRVGRDPLLDILCLADVEHLAGRIEHAIDAGRRRRELGVAQQCGASGPDRAGRFDDVELQLFAVGQRLLLVVLDELAGRINVFVATGHCRIPVFVTAGARPPHGK